MVNTRMISECGFYEIFNFAKEKYGVEWNPANDLFFKTVATSSTGTCSRAPTPSWCRLVDR